MPNVLVQLTFQTGRHVLRENKTDLCSYRYYVTQLGT